MTSPGNSVLSRPLNHQLRDESLLGIEVPKTEELPPEDIQIKNFRYIGSYNWAPDSDESDPVILVPGSPPEWIERPMPFTVESDTGIHYRDRNGHMLPGRPLLPLVAAVHEQNIQPTLDWKTIDIVSDRNSFRKLLRWIRRTGRDFRINIDLIGKKTVLLNRWEQQTIDILNGTLYGFGYENAATRSVPGLEGTSGHARIATYDYGGLKMVLQFEVDAYLPQNGMTAMTDIIEVDNLIETLSDVNNISKETTVKRSFGLGIVRKGKANILDNSIIELATTTRKLDWKERYPQLFFSQTPHHYLAWHDQARIGTFYRLDKRTIDCPLLQNANGRLQPAFKKLKKILELIQQIVIEHGQKKKLALLCVNKGLAVYERLDDDCCLPEEALALWDN